MYALMIFTATGADGVGAETTALYHDADGYLRVATGAKLVKTASSRPVLLTPFCAVPVFAAICMPGM